MIPQMSTVTLGSLTLRCSIRRLITPIVIETIIPGRAGGVTQAMGKAGDVFILEGTLSGQTKDTDKTTMQALVDGSTTYTMAYGSYSQSVVVAKIDLPETLDGLGNWPYKITVKELNQPVSP